MNEIIKKLFEEIDSILSVNSDGKVTLDVRELHKIEEKYMKENPNSWISIEEGLPKESKYYLTTNIELGNQVSVLHYSDKHKLFNTFDETPIDIAMKFCLPVTHWMPAPTLPIKKGGEQE